MKMSSHSDSLPKTIIGAVLVFCLLCCLSSLVDGKAISRIKLQKQKQHAMFVCCFLQFVAMPFIGFVTIRYITQLKFLHGIGILLTVCAPGGSYSNVFCYVFNFDLALSIGMTAVGSIIALVFMPLNLAIYAPLAFDSDLKTDSVWDHFNIPSLITQMVAVLLGASCGAWISFYRPHWTKYTQRLGILFGVIVLLWSAASSGSTSEKREAGFLSAEFPKVCLTCVIIVGLGSLLTTSVFLIGQKL